MVPTGADMFFERRNIMGRRLRNVMVLVLLVFALAVVAQARVNLQITEIYAGTSPKTPGGAAFDTSEWFEITNFGGMAADLVANPVYYDDESADPTKDAQLLGVGTIAAGESVIFFVDWESDLPGADNAAKLALAYSLFATAWGPLTGVQIGYCDTTAGGLGNNGDTMYLFDSNLAGANIIDTAGYTGHATSTYVSQPDGTWNGMDGSPGSNDLAGVGGLPGWPALVLFGGPPITLLGSPGVVPVRTIIPLNPSPTDGSTDVMREVVLSWTPGKFADQHDVYFGTGFDDVNDATNLDPMGPDNVYRARQDANSYTPHQLLDFGTTYYWRVDEVNAPPDYTVYQGDVWSFTTEPFAYPIENITATASSQAANREPENTVNSSGLDDSGLLHDKKGDDTMWLSNIAGPQPSWIEFEFDGVYKMHELWVWNSNDSLEPMIGFGFKDVTIEYSSNGTDYTTLGTTHEFARAPGAPDYAHDTTIDMGGVPAKYVRLTANSNWGGILNQYGLSEVRFFHIPVLATKPYPDSGATDVVRDVVLGWRAGREAVTHDVYVSADEQAVIDGIAPVATVAETSYGPLALDLDTTHYWKVNEVNEAETTSTWESNIWTFTTSDHIVVDDFESYNDLDPADPKSNRIFNVWIDGYGIATNGSLVGYENPPFCEQTIVHGGKQSMPFFYSNTGGAASSEAELTLTPAQDWTEAQVQTLAVHFHGTEGNTGQLYVKINGSKVTYDGQATNLALAGSVHHAIGA
jgi:hypothetical protein